MTDEDEELKSEQELLELLSEQEFEVGTPQIFFKCDSGVFVKDGSTSLFYTTSIKKAEVLAAIMNDWARLRKLERTTS